MGKRIAVTKTYKLFVGGGFPRSESGRSIAVTGGGGKVLAHVAHASRKDLRDAVVAARGALGGWSSRTAYNRGQILYRMAEMLEGKGDEFAGAIRDGAGRSERVTAAAARREVEACVDRLVVFAGWCDKYQHVLGSHNAVAGPYHNFSLAEPTGVVVVFPAARPALLGLVSLIAPVLAGGNTVIAAVGQGGGGGGDGEGDGGGGLIPAALLGEVLATSDVPGGVVNILTGDQEELAPHAASHRDINGIFAAGQPEGRARVLRGGTAENIKRVRVCGAGELEGGACFDAERCGSPWLIEPFVETKTLWHPSAT